MPWFLKTLSESTTKAIELRVCGNEDFSNEDILLQVIELFVYWISLCLIQFIVIKLPCLLFGY